MRTSSPCVALPFGPGPRATGTRRVSAPSHLAQRDVAKTWYPANLAEKFARLSLQGRDAKLLAQSRKTIDAITWRTCPRLLGRADLEETEQRNYLLILRELTDFLNGTVMGGSVVSSLFSITYGQVWALRARVSPPSL